MSDINETFFTAIGCMDGRVQDPIAKYGRKKFGVLYADTINEAGIVGLLAKNPVDEQLLKALKFKISDVSLGKHHAKGIVVHGHAECAGNPVSEDVHKENIREGVKKIKDLIHDGVPVVGVFVKRSETNPSEWIVEEVL